VSEHLKSNILKTLSKNWGFELIKYHQIGTMALKNPIFELGSNFFLTIFTIPQNLAERPLL